MQCKCNTETMNFIKAGTKIALIGDVIKILNSEKKHCSILDLKQKGGIDLDLNKGTILYSFKSYDRIEQIIKNGFSQNIGSPWDGDLELGKGFYCAAEFNGAESYKEGTGAILKIVTTGNMCGKEVKPPQKFDWSLRKQELEELCSDYDFLISSDDIPVSQYKFNYNRGTDKLRIEEISLLNGSGLWEWHTVQRYREIIEGDI